LIPGASIGWLLSSGKHVGYSGAELQDVAVIVPPECEDVGQTSHDRSQSTIDTTYWSQKDTTYMNHPGRSWLVMIHVSAMDLVSAIAVLSTTVVLMAKVVMRILDCIEQQ